ncbi:hypothetical protein [Methylobacterium nigriterrae]|uniref:hypothetical protein n=1 Tax=Methylobacterium nigriterrae TaxID=3127512 RepID=UPI003013A87F
MKRPTETIRVTDVSKILVTEIVADNGQQLRAIRVWGSAGAEGLPILGLQAAADTSDAIKITTPEIKF